MKSGGAPQPDNGERAAPQTPKRPKRRLKNVLAVFLVVAVASGGLYAYVRLSSPFILALEPAVAEPGSVIRIIGSNFGDRQGDSRVIMDGVEPTRSSYRSWTATAIDIAVPPTVDSGLVRVYTSHGASNPAMFLSAALLPLVVSSSSGVKSP